MQAVQERGDVMSSKSNGIGSPAHNRIEEATGHEMRDIARHHYKGRSCQECSRDPNISGRTHAQREEPLVQSRGTPDGKQSVAERIHSA